MIYIFLSAQPAYQSGSAAAPAAPSYGSSSLIGSDPEPAAPVTGGEPAVAQSAPHRCWNEGWPSDDQECKSEELSP